MTPTRTVGPLDARRGSTGGVESAVVLLPIGVCIGLLALVWPSPGVTTLALAAGLLVPGVATAALLRRRPRPVTAADVVTLGRVALTGVVATATVLVLAGELPGRGWALAAVVGLALALDAADGYVARRTGTASEAGARLDMESDAALLLVLSVLAGPTLGWWVIAIGAMRYLFVLASWVRPALRGPLAPRGWRRVVAALQGIALVTVLVPVVPVALAGAACVVALLLLAGSFTRDVVDLETRA